MRYSSITVYSDKNSVEKIADLMWAVSDGGVEIFDAEDIDVILKDFSWDYLDEKVVKKESGRPYARCVVPEESLVDASSRLAAILSENAILVDERDIVVESFEEKDWENDWKLNYKKVVEGRYSIVPVWEKDSDSEENNIYINPSSGFGTGQHESTAIVLYLMNNIDFGSLDVLDLGTGSGILGIAAAKSGASKVKLSDYDAAAIDNAVENVELNNVQSIAECVVEDAFKAEFKDDYDVILANLTADILSKLVRKISDALKPNGRLIISGILSDRMDNLKKAFAEVGLEVVQTEVRGEWSGALLKKYGH